MSKLYDVPGSTEGKKIKVADILNTFFSFLVFLISAIIAGWMIYSFVTTGSVFPSVFSSVSNNVVKGIGL